MSARETNGLYLRLRSELLRTALHHRRSLWGLPWQAEHHRRDLRAAQRQMGALRQAYRRSREVSEWEAYARGRNHSPLSAP